MADLSDLAKTSIETGDPVVDEAHDRWLRGMRFESKARTLFLEDLKFANGDSDNGYQWPNDIRRNRDVDERPTITNNKVRQHNLQIINDAKQNKPAITIRPTGNGATYEAAQALNAVIRHIEYQSFAQVAYDTATTFQVDAGVGYLRVMTDWVQGAWEQEIFIRGFNNPLQVLIDPDAKERDKSDANFAFVFNKIQQDEFDKLYPEYAGQDLGGQSAIGENDEWIDSDYIQVAEYFRRVRRKNTLIKKDGKTHKLTDFPPEMYEDILALPNVMSREMEEIIVEWFFIVGYKVVDSNVWPGQYIPIVPVVGEEMVIDGILDRKGHTRNLKDPQRMFNYWSSAAVEHVALQGKSPYIAAAESIEGYETYWDTANKINHSVLPYNALDDAANPLPAPQRAQPPQMAPAYVEGWKMSQQDMDTVSGQFAATFGQPSNERSGKAINERQRQGDKATYHFIDNLAIALRHVGRIILDILPKIYDTQRVVNCLAEDGTSFDVMIDPQQMQAFQAHRDHNNEIAKRVLNPAIGRYSVQADIGPSYGTRREEAFNALTLLLTQAPGLTNILGDILFQAADFPMADEAAARLRRLVPPQAMGTGPTMAEQQMQMQIKQLEQMLQAGMAKSGEAQMKLRSKDAQKEIDVYNAETNRMKVFLGEMGKDPYGLKAVVEQLVSDALKEKLGLLGGEEEGGVEEEGGGLAGGVREALNKPPEPGARMGSNGLWYGRDYFTNPDYAPLPAEGAPK